MLSMTEPWAGYLCSKHHSKKPVFRDITRLFDMRLPQEVAAASQMNTHLWSSGHFQSILYKYNNMPVMQKRMLKRKLSIITIYPLKSLLILFLYPSTTSRIHISKYIKPITKGFPRNINGIEIKNKPNIQFHKLVPFKISSFTYFLYFSPDCPQRIRSCRRRKPPHTPWWEAAWRNNTPECHCSSDSS